MLAAHVSPQHPGVIDEAPARRALRAQIAQLEAGLAAAHLAVRPVVPFTPVTGSLGGPRVLGIGDLERVRDDLADRLSAVRRQAAALTESQEQARTLVERMLLDPAAHPWRKVTGADLGEPGCKSYHVRPRLGLVGMLMGWWRVKISSGCPLASAADGPPQPQAHRSG